MQDKIWKWTNCINADFQIYIKKYIFKALLKIVIIDYLVYIALHFFGKGKRE